MFFPAMTLMSFSELAICRERYRFCCLKCDRLEVAANDLALLKADGRFAAFPLPPVARGFWAARWRRLVFPTSACRGSRPSWPGINAKAKDAKAQRISSVWHASWRLCGFALDFFNGALAAGGALPENVNYAVKSREGRHVAVPNFRDADTASLPVLESVPAVSAKLKAPNTADEKIEDVVKSAQDAAVLVLVY